MTCCWHTPKFAGEFGWFFPSSSHHIQYSHHIPAFFSQHFDGLAHHIVAFFQLEIGQISLFEAWLAIWALWTAAWPDLDQPMRTDESIGTIPRIEYLWEWWFKSENSDFSWDQVMILIGEFRFFRGICGRTINCGWKITERTHWRFIAGDNIEAKGSCS